MAFDLLWSMMNIFYGVELLWVGLVWSWDLMTWSCLCSYWWHVGVSELLWHVLVEEWLFYLGSHCYAEVIVRMPGRPMCLKFQFPTIVLSVGIHTLYWRVNHMGVRPITTEVFFILLLVVTIRCWAYGRVVHIIGRKLKWFNFHVPILCPDDMIYCECNHVGINSLPLRPCNHLWA